ncbi:hypothetical protein [Actinocorallia longicatena]|uniref:Uncharacterized protein n=1 Tax=Actinocorallia longicatena TaxID=111803 RepID=A0ABP6QRV7_9ACTN
MRIHTGRTLRRIAFTWLTPPLLVLLLLGLCRMLAPGSSVNQSLPDFFEREFYPSGSLYPLTGYAWLLIAIGLFATAMIVFDQVDSGGGSGGGGLLVAAFALLGVFVLAVPFITAVWNNDKDHGRFYSAATVYHVPSVEDPPSSLTGLLEGAKPGTNGCDRAGAHDVRSCVKVDDSFKTLAWEPRTTSLAAARTAMTNAASPVQNVDVMDGSLSYLYGETAGQGRWAAVLDGTGAQSAYGVAEWDGSANAVRVCRFTGGHRFDRAFGGSGGNSLHNLLADRFSGLHFDEDDVWGYCQGDEPRIVVRVTSGKGYANRRVEVPAGVLILRGSPSGRPVMEHRARIGPGELPGPVYPTSLVRVQKDANSWTAGRANKDEKAYGYQRSEYKTQKDNRGEYLMRGTDRRLYYLTPLTPHASKSESLIAYGVVRADEVASGRLNTYDIHVLADGDPAVVSLPNLDAKAIAYVSGPQSPYPNFLNSGGALQEFMPLGGGKWRVYGVQNGQTVFYIDLASTGALQPKTVLPGAPQAAAPSKDLTCASPPKDLPDRLLAQCLSDLASELRRRNPGG